MVVIHSGWILRGFFDSGIQQNEIAFSEFTRHAVEIIDWGRKIWKDVPRADRGTIFDSTFLRGALSLEIEALGRVWGAKIPLHNLIHHSSSTNLRHRKQTSSTSKAKQIVSFN